MCCMGVHPSLVLCMSVNGADNNSCLGLFPSLRKPACSGTACRKSSSSAVMHQCTGPFDFLVEIAAGGDCQSMWLLLFTGSILPSPQLLLLFALLHGTCN